MRTAAIVLAAGKSSRMGQNKLLLKVEGVTVLDKLLTTLSEAIDEVIVVTGHDPTPVRIIAEAHGVRLVHNPDYELGMTTSFKSGLKTLENIDAVFLVLGDQLGLKSSLLKLMMKEMVGNPGTVLVSPIYKGRKGHPILIRSNLFKEFLDLNDDGIMRDVVQRHEAEHRTILGDKWTNTDFDTPQDFYELKKQLGSI